MAIHIYGNDPNQNLTVASGDISGDLIKFGNGASDFVLADNGNISNNTITFGNGYGDNVQAQNGDVAQNVITFGDGNQDFVATPFNLNRDTITFGNGEGDFVAVRSVNQDVIVFGSGGDDQVETGFGNKPGSVGGDNNLSNSSITFHDIASDLPNVVGSAAISNSKITFGDADFDSVSAGAGVNNNTFTFGNGNRDVANLFSVSNNTFTFGNGNEDQVLVGPSSNNKITLGNGQNDVVSLDTGFTKGSTTSLGGDYIATGTGAGDTVAVGAHTDADTFAFALGTTGTNFVMVTGAQTSDQVVVNSNGNGHALGSTLVSEGTSDTNLSAFITSLGTLTKGDTYVGFNTSANETFIVTDTASGQTGAIELTGVAFQTSTLANHVLTLHA